MAGVRAGRIRLRALIGLSFRPPRYPDAIPLCPDFVIRGEAVATVRRCHLGTLVAGMRGRRAPRGVVLLLAAVVAVAGATPTAADVLDDPYRTQQWYLDHLGVPEAWDVTRGEGVTIAVLDSGVDLGHPDLVDQFLRDPAGNVVGRDLVEDDGIPHDRNGHGTMVAGIAAAAANGKGVVGVAPGASLMPVRVLDADGGGLAADVEAGIRWAVDHGADVVNLSLEAEEPGGDIALPVDAIRYAWEQGVVVVAAVGNSGVAMTDYPHDAPLLLVGAVDRDDEPTLFSDWGRSDLVMAPGVEIISTWCEPLGEALCDPTFRYGEADGTSFAAPQVSGAVALLLAAGATAADAVRQVRATAEDLGAAGLDTETGYGRLDVAKAMQAAAEDPAVARDDGPLNAAGDAPVAGGVGAPSPGVRAPSDAADESAPEDPAGAAGARPGLEVGAPSPFVRWVAPLLLVAAAMAWMTRRILR